MVYVHDVAVVSYAFAHLHQASRGNLDFVGHARGLPDDALLRGAVSWNRTSRFGRYRGIVVVRTEVDRGTFVDSCSNMF